MKAIILSAGQGSRLLPMTRNLPKCCLPVNGDTLFKASTLGHFLCCERIYPVTLAIDRKTHYDSDDMKVCADGERLLRVCEVNEFSDFAHAEKAVKSWQQRRSKRPGNVIHHTARTRAGWPGPSVRGLA